MSREIKFRVWDEDNNKILRISSFTNLENLRYDLDAIEDYFGRGYFKDNPNYLMQFTGLKDKNNVDIYEGDYICLDGLKTHRWEIYYSGLGFIASPLSGNSPVEYRTLQNNNYLQFEVIGNIHENK